MIKIKHIEVEVPKGANINEVEREVAKLVILEEKKAVFDFDGKRIEITPQRAEEIIPEDERIEFLKDQLKLKKKELRAVKLNKFLRI